MSLNFVAFDIETAAAQWNTICSISLVRVENGAIIEDYSTLINPECEFSPMNISIHGITPEMVNDAPIIPDVADKIIDFIGSFPLVSHNISFDANVLQRTFSRYSIALPHIDIFCTLLCAKALLPDIEKYRLNNLCNLYGIPLENHHDAKDDAYACAMLMLALCNSVSAFNISEVAHSANIRLGSMDSSGVTLPRPVHEKKKQESHNEVLSSTIEDLPQEIKDMVAERMVTIEVMMRCPLQDIRNLNSPGKGYAAGSKFWRYGEIYREHGDLDESVILFDEARFQGYDAPALYESYVKVFRQQKDYENEISIIDEFLSRNTYGKEGFFIARREKASQLLQNARIAEEKKKLKEEKLAKQAGDKARKASEPKVFSGRSIIQLNDDGTIVNEFISIASAVKETGISSKSIRDAANGVQKHAGGYCWRYKEQ